MADIKQFFMIGDSFCTLPVLVTHIIRNQLSQTSSLRKQTLKENNFEIFFFASGLNSKIVYFLEN